MARTAKAESASNETTERVDASGESEGAVGYFAMRAEVGRKLKEYKRVLAETEERRERAVRTLRKAGCLRD